MTNYLIIKGPDPAEPNRILIRKIVQINEATYAYEETRITRNEGKQPTVHTQMSKLHDVNLREDLTDREINIRGQHRAMPNVTGFSLYYRKTGYGTNHFSIVENSLWKISGNTWSQWWSNWNDRRDMSAYLRTRWVMN